MPKAGIVILRTAALQQAPGVDAAACTTVFSPYVRCSHCWEDDSERLTLQLCMHMEPALALDGFTRVTTLMLRNVRH